MSDGYSTYLSFVTSMDLEQVLTQATSVWVFGYGSLTWKPDFNYNRKEIGYIRGFKRRFWQGNETHRGTKEKIGRVATLLPAKKGKVWGVAFEISGKEAMSKALGGLTTREITLGGYIVTSTHFHPRDKWTKPKPAMLYMATKENDLFLGKSDIDTMAMEIALASGQAGTNAEYVTKLADYVREHIPEEHDKHLFALDKRVREFERVLQNNLFSSLIGETELFERHIDATDDTDIEYDVTLLKSPSFKIHRHHHEITHRMIF